MVHPRVFLDFAIDGSSIGRVIFELYNVSAPKTAENFKALCTGERGISPKSQIPLYYKHSKMHRVIQDFMIQGGDFTKGNGTGGESIYGGPFPDEDLSRPVDQQGLLCMANKGPNTNNSQFFITLRPSPHLSGKHVVFGRVIRGFDDVIQKIANVKTDEKDRPVVPVEIVNCGELQLIKRPPSAGVAVKGESERERERNESGSESESEEKRGRKRRKRRLHSSSRSRSRSRSRSDSRSLSRSRSRSRLRSPSRSRFSSRSRSPSRARFHSRSRSPSDGSSSEVGYGRHKSKIKRKKNHLHNKDKKDKKEKKEKKEKKHKKHKKHKHHSRSRSRSPSRSLSRTPPRSHSRNQLDARKAPKPPHQETEEEYDARLEREERERLEIARLRELAEIKRRYEAERERREKEREGGVRFKGRGRMKFVDPELHSRRNY